MTVAERRPPEPAQSDPGDPPGHASQTLQCPFLTSSDGAWRSATAARDHRCAAVTPGAPLATEKQRRLCLTPDHQTCATFVAAVTASGALPGRAAGMPRPIARTVPVVLDVHRFGSGVPAFLERRSTGQTVLVAVMVVAFMVVAIAKSAVGGVAPIESASPRASAVASATAGATATPRATVRATASAAATPRVTAVPSAAPKASTAPKATTRASARPKATKR